jgi:hypothetical protein
VTEKIVQPSDLNQQQINILAVSAIRALIRKGYIQKEDITVEISQQGVPADWALLIFEYVRQMPVENNPNC